MKPGFHRVPPGSYYPLKHTGSAVTKMNRKALSLIVMTLLATSTTGLSLVYAQAAEPRSQAAETLLSVLENTNGKVSALFDSVTAGGGQVPQEAQEQLQLAITLRAQAQALFDAGEYGECIKKSTESLNAYGKATARLHLDDDDDEPEEEENLGLFTAVERARAYIDKLRSAASELESQGIDVSEVESLLDQADTALDGAEDALNQGDFDEAKDLLGEARSLMSQATGELRSLSNTKRKEKTEHFINQTMIRVRQLEEKMLRVLSRYGVSEEDTQALVAEFRAMTAALEGMDLDRDDLDDVVDRLKHLVKESYEFGKDYDEVEDETVERINDVSKLEAKINRYRERLRELEQLGYNTGNVTAIFAEVEGLLSEAMVKLEDGDREAAEDLIHQADEMLEDIDDMIDDAEDEDDDNDSSRGNRSKRGDGEESGTS